MDRKTFEEPDLVTPPMRYSPYRTYDLNIWSTENFTLNITAYKLCVDKDDPEEIVSTDYDSEYFTESYDLKNKRHHEVLNWWLCKKLGYLDWTALGDLDEWNTYHADTEDFVTTALGEPSKAPMAVRKMLDNLPAYEPRLV